MGRRRLVRRSPAASRTRTGGSTLNAKLALTPQRAACCCSKPTTILLLGTDNAESAAATGDTHSDSIMLMRTDPARHRIYYLSIPRDIVVPIPGAGTQKINAAMQIGGPALAIKTIHAFVGHPDQPRRGRQLRASSRI